MSCLSRIWARSNVDRNYHWEKFTFTNAVYALLLTGASSRVVGWTVAVSLRVGPQPGSLLL